MARINLDVNGKVHTIDADPDTPLLYVLRNDLSPEGPHFGCGLAQSPPARCRSTARPARSAHSARRPQLQDHDARRARHTEKPHPLQKAFIAEQAPQRGYCLNGLIMTAAALLDRDTPHPSEQQDPRRALWLQMPMWDAYGESCAPSAARPR